MAIYTMGGVTYNNGAAMNTSATPNVSINGAVGNPTVANQAGAWNYGATGAVFTPTPAPTTPAGPTKTSPVVTAAPATANLQNIQTNVDNAKGAIANQQATVSVQQQAAAEKASQDKATADQLALQQQEQKNKAATIAAATAPETTTTTPTPTGGTQTTTNPVQNQTPTQPNLSDQLKNVTDARDASWAQFQTSLTAYQQGTIPLTPTQSALVSSMQQVAQSVRDTQVQANSNYVGGTTTLQQVLGLSRYAPDMAMGAIQNAVTVGQQKLQDLDAKAAQSLAQVEQGFEDSNFKVIQASYDEYNKYLDTKQKTITDTYNAVQKQADDLRTYQLDLAKFVESTTEANAAAKEKAQVDLWTHNYQMEDLKIKQEQANATNLTGLGTGAGGLPGSNTTSLGTPIVNITNGKPDTAAQTAFLAKLPVMTQTLIKNLTSYQGAPPTLTGSAAAVAAKEQLLALAHEYDPSYDEGSYTVIHKTMQDFTSGKSSQNVNSLNTTVGHLSELANDFQNLPNADITKFNSVGDYLSSNFGGGATTKVQLELSALTGELATTFKGGGRGATDNEIAIMNKGFSMNSSPEQFKSAIETSINLMGSRLGALQDTYEAGAQRPAPDGLILHNTTVKTLSAFKDAGYDVNIPGIPFTNSQSFYASSPDNAQVWNDTLSQMQSLEQQGVLDPNAIYAPSDVLKMIYLNHPELMDANTNIKTAPGAGAPNNSFVGSEFISG